jgi:hypothetical protein
LLRRNINLDEGHVNRFISEIGAWDEILDIRSERDGSCQVAELADQGNLDFEANDKELLNIELFLEKCLPVLQICDGVG